MVYSTECGCVELILLQLNCHISHPKLRFIDFPPLIVVTCFCRKIAKDRQWLLDSFVSLNQCGSGSQTFQDANVTWGGIRQRWSSLMNLFTILGLAILNSSPLFLMQNHFLFLLELSMTSTCISSWQRPYLLKILGTIYKRSVFTSHNTRV